MFARADKDFKNDFPQPPAEPLTAKQLFDLFVLQNMLTRMEETNKYYMQKNGPPLNLAIEELNSALGVFFRDGCTECHTIDLRKLQVASILQW